MSRQGIPDRLLLERAAAPADELGRDGTRLRHMLALLVLGGLAAMSAVIGLVILRVLPWQPGRPVLCSAGPGRRPLSSPCGWTIVVRDGYFAAFLGCNRYRNGYGCPRVWNVSGRRFFEWELHRRRAA
jgi:hypothetical protein